MYFCEDHTSYSEDGTVRYCGDDDNDLLADDEASQVAEFTFAHELTCLSDKCAFENAVLSSGVHSTSEATVKKRITPPKPINLPGCSSNIEPQPQLHLVNGVDNNVVVTPSLSNVEDNASDSFTDFVFQEVESKSVSAPNSPRLSICSSPLLNKSRHHKRGVSDQTPNVPPPYPGSQVMLTGGTPYNGLHRVGSNKAFVVPTAGTSYPFQEIREISLGRHNEEPFGMKVEAISDGFYITHVVKGSVAACAGLKMGDEIVRINDRRLENLKTKEVLQIIRESEVCVKLAYKPRAVVARIREVKIHKNNGVLGLRLQRRSDGIFIDYVKKGTPAFQAGLKDSDQVLKINGHVVTEWSMEGAMALLKSVSDNEQLILVVRETLPLAHINPNSPPIPEQTTTTANGASPCLSRQTSSEKIPNNHQYPSDHTSQSSSQNGTQAATGENSTRNPCVSRTEPEETELTTLPSNNTNNNTHQPVKSSHHKFSFFKSNKNSHKQSGSLSSSSSMKEKG